MFEKETLYILREAAKIEYLKDLKRQWIETIVKNV